jgi:hypothetical protein
MDPIVRVAPSTQQHTKGIKTSRHFRPKRIAAQNADPSGTKPFRKAKRARVGFKAGKLPAGHRAIRHACCPQDRSTVDLRQMQTSPLVTDFHNEGRPTHERVRGSQGWLSLGRPVRRKRAFAARRTLPEYRGALQAAQDSPVRRGFSGAPGLGKPGSPAWQTDRKAGRT